MNQRNVGISTDNRVAVTQDSDKRSLVTHNWQVTQQASYWPKERVQFETAGV